MSICKDKRLPTVLIYTPNRVVANLTSANAAITNRSLNSLMKKLGLVLIQYIVLGDHNPVFMISRLCSEVRFSASHPQRLKSENRLRSYKK